MTDARFVFYHKQATSARMRFMVFDTGSVLSGAPLPTLSVLEEVERDYDEETIVAFPANGLGAVVDGMGIDKKDVAMKFPDVATVQTPQANLPVHGVQFTNIDPPFDEIEKVGGKFIEMTQARQLHHVDMEIVRRIYVHEMGG